MQLKEFVKETLVQIINGIQEAQDAISSEGAEVNPQPARKSAAAGNDITNQGQRIHNVFFDVAVMASGETGAKGGGGINVVGVQIGGGVSTSETSATHNKIQFHVPITYPRSKKTQ